MNIDLDFLEGELNSINRQIREMEDKIQHAHGAADILKQLMVISTSDNPYDPANTNSVKPLEPEEEDATEPDSHS